MFAERYVKICKARDEAQKEKSNVTTNCPDTKKEKSKGGNCHNCGKCGGYNKS